MGNNTKEWLQYGSALTMMMSGVVLTYIDYFISHDVHTNVLWYVAQTLVYAGGIFGVALVMNTKFGEIRSFVTNELKKDRDEKH